MFQMNVFIAIIAISRVVKNQHHNKVQCGPQRFKSLDPLLCVNRKSVIIIM